MPRGISTPFGSHEPSSNPAFVPVSDMGGVGLGRPLVALRSHGTRPIHVVVDLQSWVTA